MKKMLLKAKLRQLYVLSSCQSRAYFAITHISAILFSRSMTETLGMEFVLDQIGAGGLMRFSTKLAQRMV